RREGKYYFITGRASVDIIKSGGYKISALDIERELLSLPYVGEAMVVGVPDAEFGQRVAAVVTLRSDEMAQKFYREHDRNPERLDIDDLRADARSRLAGYKLPTLLRILNGEIPKSPTGKVVKKQLDLDKARICTTSEAMKRVGTPQRNKPMREVPERYDQ
ncbi:MAG: hypothetical protein M1823_007476, partial [Watsoniomyces obsoletus]